MRFLFGRMKNNIIIPVEPLWFDGDNVGFPSSYLFPKIIWQGDVLHCGGSREKRGYLVGREAGYTTTDAGDEEMLVGMLLGVCDELVNIGADGVNASLHGGDGIALPLHAVAIAHYGTEMQMGNSGGTASVHTGKIATEDKHLIGL